MGSALLLGLYLARAQYCGRGMFGFLLFNTLLAWIPWLLAVALGYAARRGARATAAVLGLAWLAFLPNAPYLLTDFLHLRARPPVPIWYDVLLLGAASLTGMLAGAFSLLRVERVASRAFGAPAARALAVASTVLAGFGIYLGRFERFNSWDLAVRPFTVLTHSLDALRPRALVVTLACAALLLMTAAALDVPAQPSRPKRSR